MKFFVSSNFKKNRHLRFAVLALLLFLFTFTLSDISVFLHSFGLDAKTISHTLWGNEEEFIEPLNALDFFTYLHTELFFMALIFIILASLIHRLYKKSRFRQLLLLLMLLAMISTTLGLFFGYYKYIIAIHIALTASYLWHAMVVVFSLDIAWGLFRYDA